jgi:adenylate kinase family enzyme
MPRHTDPVPLLDHTASLRSRPCRILISGTSGSGKSTLARAVGNALGLPYHELDALYHGPNWVPNPQFVDEVATFAATDRWVCEWQYSQVRALLLERADLVVWLDHPRRVVMSRVIRRTVYRRLRRVRLWNGNTEDPLWTFFTDPEHIVRWAFATYRRDRARMLALVADRHPVRVVRLAGQRRTDAWLVGPLAAVS